jgi:L-lactate dehydrogenase complex protein LldE
LKVSLFVTCLVDQFYPQVGVSTVRVLQKLGCEVDFPQAQVCCGQPAYNAGYPQEARQAALTLLEAFQHSDYVVTPSGSCGAMVHHGLPGLFAGDPDLAKRAQALAAKTFEFSQFLVQILKVENLEATLKTSATFHPSCHAMRMLGVKDEPARLLGSVKGLELKPLNRAEDCCGFGGSFAVKMGELSSAMAQEKCGQVVKTGAEVLMSTDAGCLMNLGGWLARHGSEVKCLHLAEVLDKAMGSDAGA